MNDNDKEKKFREFYKSATGEDLPQHVKGIFETELPLVLKVPPRGPLQRRDLVDNLLGAAGSSEITVVSPNFENHGDQKPPPLIDRMQDILKCLKQRATDQSLVLGFGPAHSDPTIADTIATIKANGGYK